MNHSMQPIMQHLFQASALEDISRERLESFVEEYPCFGFGHYLLSRKLRATDDGQYLAATQKTSLYFPNPFWLQWILENAPGAKPAAQVRAQPAPAEHHIAEPVAQAEALLPIEQPIRDEEPPFVLEEPTPEPTPAAIHGPLTDQLLESIEKAREIRESLQKITDNFITVNGQPPAEPIRDEEPPFVLDEPEHPVLIEPAPEIPAHSAPAAEAPVIADSTPLFEPLHTIDYFASQGIRLSIDENPTDNLGRQMKSFTEWLKTMRRLPQKDRVIVPDRVAEEAVQSFAAHSIEGKEVVTETMAEVLAKQGMPERARIVYEKLSLLNPEKSAYFAAKIEQLNFH